MPTLAATAMKENFRIPLRGSGDLSADERDLIKYGHWRLECPQMTLRSRGQGPRKTFSGPGYIYQPLPGTLAFQLYPCRKQQGFRSGWMDLAKTGELLPEEAYFDLVAIDQAGRRWRSVRFVPDSIDRATSGKLVARGDLKEIATRGVLPRTLKVTGHTVGLQAFDKLDLPWNAVTVSRSTIAKGRQRQRSNKYERNVWAFRCHGLDILVVQLSDRVSIEAYSRSEALHANIAVRLREAMEFVVGQSVSFEIVRTRRAFTIETVVRRRDSAPHSA